MLLAWLLVSLFSVGVYYENAVYLTVVGVFVFLCVRESRFLVAVASAGVLLWLGQISYSLYLVHGYSGMVLSTWSRTTVYKTELAFWIAIAMTACASLASSVVLNSVCEMRAVQWSRRIRIQSTKDLSAQKTSQD